MEDLVGAIVGAGIEFSFGGFSLVCLFSSDVAGEDMREIVGVKLGTLRLPIIKGRV